MFCTLSLSSILRHVQRTCMYIHVCVSSVDNVTRTSTITTHNLMHYVERLLGVDKSTFFERVNRFGFSSVSYCVRVWMLH